MIRFSQHSSSLLFFPILAHSHQINLKTFYPFIAYLFDYLRRVADPKNPTHLSHIRKIVKAPVPRVHRATRSTQMIHHTIVLGEDHVTSDNGVSLLFWKQHQTKFEDIFKLYYQTIREVWIPELTLAISMTLLAEIYSSDYAQPMEMPVRNAISLPNDPKPCFRLEYGRSPISDFGICRGKIRSKKNCVQVWTYYDPRNRTRTTLADPDNYFWLYFKTIRGEMITLDCCSYSFGMECFIDAGSYIAKLPEHVRAIESARVPAFFQTPQDRHRQPYELVEEARFSVMHTKDLHDALSTRTPHQELPYQKRIIREFISRVLGRQCTPEEEERTRRFRSHVTAAMNEVLSKGYWRDWEKPVVYRDNLLEGGAGGWEKLKTLFKDSSTVQAHNERLGLF